MVSNSGFIIMSPAGRGSQQRLAFLALLLGALALGFSPVLVRLSGLGPVSTAFWRMMIALLPLAIMQLTERAQPSYGPQRIRRFRDFVTAGLPGVFLAGDLACWHTSLHMTSVANATLLVNFAPVFVAIGAWLFLKQRPERSVIAGLGVAIFGVLVLKGGLPDFNDGDLKGDLVALLAAVFLAIYMILMTEARRHYTTVSVMFASSVATGLTLLPLAYFAEQQFFPVTLQSWAVVAAMGLVCHVIGQGAISFALAWLPVAFSSLTLLLQPVIAAMLAWWLLGESVSFLQALGGAIVLFGIFLARRR